MLASTRPSRNTNSTYRAVMGNTSSWGLGEPCDLFAQQEQVGIQVATQIHELDALVLGDAHPLSGPSSSTLIGGNGQTQVNSEEQGGREHDG